MNEATRTPTPFHVGAGWQDASRRILLVSWEFPPRPTAGALRWEKFSRFLHQEGYGLDVITADPGELDAAALERLAALPPSVRAFALPLRPRWLEKAEERLAALGRSVLGRGRSSAGGSGTSASGKGADSRGEGHGPPRKARPVSLPPERITWRPQEPRDVLRAFWAMVAYQRDMGWGEDAASLARAIVTDRTVAVATCGPPHGAHVAGRRLGRALGVPHILDYRDPWSLPRRVSEAHASPVAFALAHRKERWILNAADLVVTNTDTVRRAMEEAHPRVPARMVTIYNGYDEEPAPGPPRRTFKVLYAGGIYLDRDPRTLFRGAALAIEETGAGPESFQVELVGNVHSYNGVPIGDLAAEQGLREHLVVRSAIPRAELLEEMEQASVLVSLPQDSPWAIPSKIFEYMPFRAAMLVYAAAGTPTAELLGGVDVDLLDPSDVEGTRRALVRHYEAFRTGRPRGPAVSDDRFSRAEQAARLLAELDRCLGGRPTQRP